MIIGLYGGTFNPIHNGHLLVAREAQRLLRLDRVIFVPAFIPPHKKQERLVPAHDRLAMVRLAIADMPYCEITDYEIQSGTVCYTIDTVRALKKLHPEWTKAYFIIGSDSHAGIFGWKEAGVLFAEVTIAVCNRPGYPVATRDPRFVYLDNTISTAASTEIRRGTAGDVALPPTVVAYAREHGYYGLK